MGFKPETSKFRVQQIYTTVGHHASHFRKKIVGNLFILQRSLVTEHLIEHLSRLMGKPTICIGENKDADQLRGNREADQRLCFRYSDSTIPLLLKSEISSFSLFSVTVQAGLCRTLLETTLLVFPRGGSFVLDLPC